MLRSLSGPQRAIVTSNAAVLQVIAAAGSGKTRTVISLAEYSVATGCPPEAILLLSFSRKAVAEIRSRLCPGVREKIEVSTFHSFCYRRLAQIDPQNARQKIDLIAEEERLRFLHERLVEEGAHLQGTPFELLLGNPALFRRRYPASSMRVFRAFANYKRTTGRLEYDDLIVKMLIGLKSKTPEAERLRHRYRLIIVDEFQDTDPSQLKFLKLMRPQRLVVVGDDWQAIYGFRGADVKPFLDFSRHFRGAARLRLAENYRSLRPITIAGNHIIKRTSRRLRKKVVAVRGARGSNAVCALSTEPGEEAVFVRRFSPIDCMLLVRSNFRRRLWIELGWPADRVSTIHRAKGLEYRLVFLDLAAGWTGRGKDNEQRSPRELHDEELRICYVGITRARDFLCVLHREQYRAGDGTGLIFEALRPLLRTVTTAELRTILAELLLAG